MTAYIIDTGISVGHPEFEGRASGGFSAIASPAADGDCNGHGTHVAGTVVGKTYGVAKGVNLVSVRALDCSGTGRSGVIAGIDWVTGQHHAGQPAVVRQMVDKSIGGRSPGVGAETERGPDLLGDQAGIGQGRQLHQVYPPDGLRAARRPGAG